MPMPLRIQFPGAIYHLMNRANSGYTLLAEVVGRVSGKSFVEFTRDEMFRPLGMTNTHFHLDHEEVVRNIAYSYSPRPGGAYRKDVLSYANVGATNLFTTAEDLANLPDYAGQYRSPELETSWSVQVKEGKLVLQDRRQGEIRCAQWPGIGSAAQTWAHSCSSGIRAGKSLASRSPPRRVRNLRFERPLP